MALACVPRSVSFQTHPLVSAGFLIQFFRQRVRRLFERDCRCHIGPTPFGSPASSAGVRSDLCVLHETRSGDHGASGELQWCQIQRHNFAQKKNSCLDMPRPHTFCLGNVSRCPRSRTCPSSTIRWRCHTPPVRQPVSTEVAARDV